MFSLISLEFTQRSNELLCGETHTLLHFCAGDHLTQCRQHDQRWINIMPSHNHLGFMEIFEALDYEENIQFIVVSCRNVSQALVQLAEKHMSLLAT